MVELKLGPLVQVTWHDAHSVEPTRWRFLSELDDDGAYVVQSVGYLVEHAKAGHVVLAQSIHHADDPAVDSLLAIPTRMVTRVAVLAAETLLPVEPD